MNLTKFALDFCELRRKTQNTGKFLENSKTFDEKSIENLNFYFILILEN